MNAANEWEQGFFDRQRDVIEAYSTGTITREQFLRDIKNLNIDYYQAMFQASEIERQAAAE